MIKRWTFMTVAVLLAAFPHMVFADRTQTPELGWTETYKVVSADGQYVLVMLNGVYEKPGKDVSPETDEKNKLLLQYPTSGLYTNDCSTRPLWSMPYISWRQEVQLSSDGHHVIVWGGWPFTSGTYRESALSFYEDGHLVASYEVNDLVSDPESLPHSVSHYKWVLGSSFDDAQGLLNVQTYNQETYIFDISTGKITYARVSTAVTENRVRLKSVKHATTTSTAIAEVAATNKSRYEEPVVGIGTVFVLYISSVGMIFIGVDIFAKTRRKHLSIHNLHEL